MFKIKHEIKHKTKQISEGVSAHLRIDVFDGEETDTEVELLGRFAVSGSSKEEFFMKLGELIDEYRI